jgi:hypothetical protein
VPVDPARPYGRQRMREPLDLIVPTLKNRIGRSRARVDNLLLPNLVTACIWQGGGTDSMQNLAGGDECGRRIWPFPRGVSGEPRWCRSGVVGPLLLCWLREQTRIAPANSPNVE